MKLPPPALKTTTIEHLPHIALKQHLAGLRQLLRDYPKVLRAEVREAIEKHPDLTTS